MTDKVIPRIAAATGHAVAGRGPAAQAVEVAVRAEIIAHHLSGSTDYEALKARIDRARFYAKPPERR